jgi:hypothetical protein
MSLPSDKLRSDIEREYVSAVEQIKNRVSENSRAAAREFESKFGEQVFSKSFFDARFKDPQKTDLQTKLALIAAERLPSEEEIAEGIFRRIVEDDQSKLLTKRYDGLYRYWRHYPIERDPNQLRWGLIQLSTFGNSYTQFSHWSYDSIGHLNLEEDGRPVSLDRRGDPEDTGFAFYSGSKMFALGFRKGNIRLAIAHVPDESQAKAKYTGIVLTTRKHGSNIFSAGFLMVHQSHPLFNEHVSQEKYYEEVSFEVRKEHMIIHN